MSSAAQDHGGLRPEPPKTFYEGTTKLPGYEKPPDRCRPLHPVGFCESGHPLLGRSSCRARYCPDHWRDWLQGGVVPIVARLAAWREVQEGSDKRMSHVVASPPQDRRYSARELWEGRGDAYEAFEAAGLDGGAAIVHPFRTNERANALFETAVEKGDVDENTGRWRFLRETCDGWDDLSRYVEAAPHYHALAAGADVDGEAAPGDWIVKRIRSFQPFDYQDSEAYEDMVATAWYVLTHAGSQEGRQSTTYFGSIHPAGFRPEEELTTAKWDRIKREAEKAVMGTVTEELEESDGPTYGPSECTRDDCEAPVRPLEELGEWLDDSDNVSGLLAARDGRKRWLRLRGLMLWSRGMTDRPPPGALTDRRKLLEWLEGQGETGVKEPRQAGLTAHVTNGPPRWAN